MISLIIPASTSTREYTDVLIKNINKSFMNFTVNYITFEKQKITFFKAISAAQKQRKNFKQIL